MSASPTKMISQKRKADPASSADLLDEPPHKRAKYESTSDIVNTQNGITHMSSDIPDGCVEHSTSTAKPPVKSQTARGTKNEAGPPTDRPGAWDQVSEADKMLVNMKENVKTSWSRIEKSWERLTGERPAKGMLQDRYQHLKKIKAQANGADVKTSEVRVTKEYLKNPYENSMPTTTQVNSTSPAVNGHSDQPSPSIVEGLNTASIPPHNADAASGYEDDSEEDLPQSWEQANAGDQLLVMMKTGRKAWTKIEEAWQDLTGKQPAEGALRDRYRRIKDLVICPKANDASKHIDQMNISTLDEASNLATSRRAKAIPRTLRNQKAEAELLDESSPEPSYHSTNMTRRKSGGTAQENTRVSTLDGPSDAPKTKRTRSKAAESSNNKAEAGQSDESNEVPESSPAEAKSAKRPRVKSAVVATSGGQNTSQTPDEMLVEMRESGSTWGAISQAWAARTGLPYVSETLRQRYARIKNGTAPKLPSITPASQKRKAEAGSPDEGSYESSRKRSKPTVESPRVAEAPVKRNMDRGKRKSTGKYLDSSTDEDELAAAPIEPAAKAAAPTRRGGGRAAKVDRSDPEWLVTNENSPLVNEDLHAEFSNPKTYENFTKSDWEDLRETLPPNIPLNPDGYSIPMNFFKYDPDFRRGIREFQEDLGSGRLDPKWQADAAQAMEERAQGKFDAYKEEQFEAFWGQKQKADHNALAGESTKIKLELLIQNDIFKVGDYFSYSRMFGRGKSGLLIEKDCKIVSLDSNALTFAIPPGQRTYSRHMFDSGTQEGTEAGATAAAAGGDEEASTVVDGKSDTVQLTAGTENNGGEASETSGKPDGASVLEGMPGNDDLTGGNKAEDVGTVNNDEKGDVDPTEAINQDSPNMEANANLPENETLEANAPEEEEPNEASAHTKSDHLTSTPALQDEEADEDILHSISNLSQLENMIVDTDGRFNSKDIATQNTWKNFRGIRSNQDLGSLFEMREEFFVYKHPRIVKEGKKRKR